MSLSLSPDLSIRTFQEGIQIYFTNYDNLYEIKSKISGKKLLDKTIYSYRHKGSLLQLVSVRAINLQQC